jgi:hypothetical protein
VLDVFFFIIFSNPIVVVVVVVVVRQTLQTQSYRIHDVSSNVVVRRLGRGVHGIVFRCHRTVDRHG